MTASTISSLLHELLVQPIERISATERNQGIGMNCKPFTDSYIGNESSVNLEKKQINIEHPVALPTNHEKAEEKGYIDTSAHHAGPYIRREHGT